MDGFIRKLSDPGFFRENRLDPHSDHVVYAPGDKGGNSSFRLSLNGSWKFHYSPDPEGMPEGFEREDYPAADWDTIRVPGHIQLQGYDSPQYVNTQYPWDGREEIDPGQIPVEFNPVASYITSFSVPEGFRGKRVFISFQGVESCFRLWLNGSYVGFSSDSFTPSEFELTEYLKDGENRLAVQVFKWYSGSWLEDQDFFRFSGIFRDVYLFAVPEQHVWDVKAEADYDPASLDEQGQPVKGWIRMTLSGLTGEAGLELELKDPDGTLLETRQVTAPKDPAVVEFAISGPRLWSAEDPQLYRVRVQVCDERGDAAEWFVQSVGIRHFEMDGTLMKLNGKRIVFKGVNRHEFSIDTGRNVSREDLLTDLYTMKRNNINAIRLCHYPNSSGIYELADELGFYLIDECNMESHGSWDSVERQVRPSDYPVPGSHMEYRDMLLDRLHSMVQRDKNHPCILIWSCGNESFGGPVIHDMSLEFKKLDPSRLVHYEGIFHDRTFNDTSDMESQMYPPVSMIKEFLAKHRDKPFICCEYMHAMGNSCGALFKYTNLAEEDPLYQGGFIWDYIDQAIRKKDRYGKEYPGYGGDFGDRPNDGNFSGNGIVYGDRTPTPKMPEVKYCYQNITVDFTEDTFTVHNQHLFTDTGKYACEVMLEKEGKLLRKEPAEVSVPPLQSRTFPLPFPVPEEEGEYVWTISFCLKEDTAWAPSGHEIAFGQAAVRKGAENKSAEPGTASLRVIHGSYNIGIKGPDFEILFSKLYGGMTSYRCRGKELLAAAVKPNFWRAPTDNDKGNMMPFRCGQWKIASLYPDSRDYRDPAAAFRLENPVLKEEPDQVSVCYTYYLPTVPMHSVQLVYAVTSDGQVRVSLEYMPPEKAVFPEFPEFSVILKMDADFHQMEWYGRGPGDCYADRKNGCRLGIWKSEVSDTVARYLVPQESGNHTDVRWMKVTDDEGRGLLFSLPAREEGSSAENPDGMDVSVSPWSPHELEEAMHFMELPEIRYTYVRIGQQMGIGGDDSWGAPVHEEFLLMSDRPRKITFTLKGI